MCVERLGWVRLTWGRASAVATLGMEVHAGWCGPSTAVVPTLKKLQWDMVEERRYSPDLDGAPVHTLKRRGRLPAPVPTLAALLHAER